MPDLHAALSDEGLIRAFGHPTVQRARAYAAGSAVVVIETDDHDEWFEARAMVTGSRSQAYYTQLNIDQDDELATSMCTCPMGHDCKHGAALAMVVRRDLAQRPGGAWQDQLTAMLEELDRLAPSGGDHALALEIAIDTHGRQRELTLRPLRTGARQRWVKGGAGWHQLRSLHTGGKYDVVQLDALIRLAGASDGARYGFAESELCIDDVGPTVWQHLREVRDAGVTLVAGAGVGSITIVDGDLALTADLSRADDGITVTLGVAHEERWWSGAEILPVGNPAHGAVLTSGRDVVLTSLSGRSGSVTARVLRSGAVHVDDDTDFHADFLPRLQRRFHVVSSDGSVEIPGLPTPVLRCHVVWHSPTHADVAWLWRYGERILPADSADALGGIRDAAAERELLARLASETGMVPPPRSVVRGAEVLDLVEVILPIVEASDLVELLEEHRPDFRAAESGPDISFEAVTEPDPVAPTDWLDLQVTITVDGEHVPLADVIAALTTDQPRIVLPSGLHLRTDRAEFVALHDLLLAAGELREVAGDQVSVGGHDLGLWAQLADLGVVDQQAAEWVERARALRDLVELPTPEPTGVVSSLRSYQLEGFHWLAFLWHHGLGGILADDMGLGKTLQVLTLISHARAGGAAPFLVVAPTSVVGAWHAESARHTPGLVVRTVTSSAARRAEALADLTDGADVVVTSYTLLRLEQDDYAALGWGGLVMDEAQQAKNHQGKTYHALRTLPAPFRLAVTGTPFENRLLELWALLSLTVPGLYPWPKDFVAHVAAPVEKGGDAAALHRFRQRIRPFLLRRTKDLVAADLPPKQEQVLEVELGSKHRLVYDTHLQRERQKVLGLVGDFDRNRVAIFSALTRLRQLALSPALVGDEHLTAGSAKLDALMEHLAEIVAEGHRVLVLSQFTRFLTMARERLATEGIATCYLDGRTRRRTEVIEQFRAGEAPVFLISLKAGGVGLTLTEADYVFVLDPWWNPASEAQAVDRAHRIGQQRPVMVYRLVARDTIEDKVMALKARKADLFAQVVSGDDGLSGAIGADDVRALFE